MVSQPDLNASAGVKPAEAFVTLIGLDIGKQSFHLIGHDPRGNPGLKKQFNRSSLIACLTRHPPCRIVMEACCGANWLARKPAGFGHTVQMIAPQYIRPFVSGNKNDIIDAQAICEAAARPAMQECRTASLVGTASPT